eukprot:m.346651 g.346651  ORF g.346651 m.346651 type:complete len:118 (+) comp29751_c0_seq1:1904-2257(+)
MEPGIKITGTILAEALLFLLPTESMYLKNRYLEDIFSLCCNFTSWKFGLIYDIVHLFGPTVVNMAKYPKQQTERVAMTTTKLENLPMIMLEHNTGVLFVLGTCRVSTRLLSCFYINE